VIAGGDFAALERATGAAIHDHHVVLTGCRSAVRRPIEPSNPHDRRDQSVEPTHVTLTVDSVRLPARLVHGITPDEHTWPITFSYAVGSYSTRRGLGAGVTFSLAFAAHRPWPASLPIWPRALVTFEGLDEILYVVVGRHARGRRS